MCIFFVAKWMVCLSFCHDWSRRRCKLIVLNVVVCAILAIYGFVLQISVDVVLSGLFIGELFGTSFLIQWPSHGYR